MAEEGRAHYSIGLDDSEFRRKINRITDDFKSIGEEGTQQGARIESALGSSLDGISGKLKNAALGFSAFFGAQQVKGFADTLVRVRGEVQGIQTALRTLIGDTDKANALYERLHDFATKTPLGLNQLADGAKMMLGFNIPLEQVEENLKAIGDISMGDAQKFQSLNLAFSQMSSAGKLMGQDLLQMINAGFNPLSEMSAKTGKSIAQLKDEMSKGAISAEMVREAFMSATGEGGKFNGMLLAQGQTLTGLQAQLDDTIETALADMGAAAEPLLKTMLEVESALVENWERVAAVIGSVVLAYGEYKAAIMLTAAVRNATAAQEVAAYNAIAAAKGADTAASSGVAAARSSEVAAARAAALARIEEQRAIVKTLALKQAEARAAAISAQTKSVTARQEHALAVSSIKIAQQRGNAEEIARAKEAARTAGLQARNAATAAQIAKENLATITTQKNTAATTLNTMQTNLHSAAQHKATLATRVLTVAQTGLKRGLDAVKLAFATNPIGMIISAITLALPLILELCGAFDDAGESAEEMSTRFGESADKAAASVETLFAVLNSASESSRVYKDAKSDLIKQMKDYGLQVDEEKTTTEELNKLHEEFTRIIKAEAIEREKANQIDTFNTKYTDSVSKAVNEAKDALEDLKGGAGYAAAIPSVFEQIVKDEDLLRIKKAREALSAYNNAQQYSQTTQLEKSKDIIEAEKIFHEYQRKIIAAAEAAGRANGENKDAINALKREYLTAANAIMDAKGALIENNKAAEAATRTAQLSTNAAIDWNDSQERSAYIARQTKASVVELERETRSLIQTLNTQAELNIKLTYDDSEVPGWLKGASIEKLREVIASRSVMLQQQNAHKQKTGRSLVTKLNGQHLTAEDNARALAMATQLLKDKEAAKAKADADKARAAEEAKNRKAATDSRGKQAANEAKRLAEEIAKLQAEIGEMEEDAKRARFERLADLEDELEAYKADAAIEAMAEGAAKEAAARQRAHDKELAEIEKRRQDALQEERKTQEELFNAREELKEKQNKGYKARAFTDEDINTAPMNAIFAHYDAQRAAAIEKYQDEEKRRHAQLKRDAEAAMRDYLSTYGTYTQQIEAERAAFQSRLLSAGTLGEAYKLAAESAAKVQAIEFERFKEGIDWEGAFSRLDAMTREQLETLKQGLRDYMAQGKLSATDYKTVAEKIESINTQLARKEGFLSGLWHKALPYLSEIEKAKQRVADATEAQAAAEQQALAAVMKRKEAQAEVGRILQKGGVSYQGEIKAEAGEAIKEAAKNLPSETIKALTDALAKLAVAQKSEAKADEQAADATSQTNEAESALGKVKKDLMKDLSPISQAVGIGVANAQSIPLMLKNFGVHADSSVMQGFEKFAEAGGEMQAALDSFMSLDIVGTIAHLTGYVTAFGESIGAFFGLDADWSEYNEMAEKYGKLNEVWASIIDRKKEYIGITYGKELTGLEAELLKVQTLANESQRALGKKYLSSGASWGSHSIAVRMRKAMDSQARKELQAALKGKRGAAFDSLRGENMGALFELTGKQLQQLKEDANYFWSSMDGTARDYLEKIIQGEEQLEELKEELTTKRLGGTSFDAFYSGWESTLLNMESSTADFAENVNKMLRESLLKGMLGGQFKDKLKKLYDKAGLYATSGETLNEEELAVLKAEALALSKEVKQAQANANAVLKAAGIDELTSGSAEGGSYGAVKQFSQEQGDEMNGRLASIQMAVWEIAKTRAMINATNPETRQHQNELLALTAQAGQYLSEVARNTAYLPAIREELRLIKANTDKL